MKELEKAVLAVMLGEAPLHPNQQKIDVVDDDKIDGKDFAKLRAMKNKKTGKIHNCAVHVEHPEYGIGRCISEAHADPDEEGNIEWYTAKFDSGTYVVKTSDIKIVASESHMHEETEQVEEMSKAMAYATGTKKAMQMTGDKPPLEKATIKKGHEIAKAMLRKEETESFEEFDEIVESKPFEFSVEEYYTFGDYLTTAKKLVGEEQAIELANNSYNSKSTDLFLEAFGRDDIEKKVKMHMGAGHQVSTPKYSTKGGEFHAEYVVTDKESGIRRKYIHHGSSRKVENMGAAGKRD
jgi:hypothetical protein